MKSNYTLNKVFYSVYFQGVQGFKKEALIPIKNEELLEETLLNYLHTTMGYRNDYSNYYAEASKYFENILVNCPYVSSFEDLIESINKYTKNLSDDMSKNKYTALFIDALRNMYSSDYTASFISNNNKKYTVGKILKNEELLVPVSIIPNIDKMEEDLIELVNAYKESKHEYGLFLGSDEENNIKEFFTWIMRNATIWELNNLDEYVKKYTSFIKDETFKEYMMPNYVGNFMDDELWFKLSKSDVAFETPYYFLFMLKNNRLKLPCVRVGIDNTSGKKVANIVAIQSAKGNGINERELDEYIKKNIPRSKNFRQYSPLHMISIILTIGLLKGNGIDRINISDYLPFRYLRLINEGRLSLDEINSQQERLTDKNINTYLRVLEFSEGIDIYSMPDGNVPFILDIGDNVHFNNEFLQSILELGISFNNKNEIQK